MSGSVAAMSGGRLGTASAAYFGPGGSESDWVGARFPNSIM